jgi:hypothetical protein
MTKRKQIIEILESDYNIDNIENVGDIADAILALEPTGEQIKQKKSSMDVLFDKMTDMNFYYLSFPAFIENENSVDVFDVVLYAMEEYANKKREEEKPTDEEIEKQSKELNIQSKGIELGKEIDDMNLELLRTGFIIGAKKMRDNSEQFKK